MIQGHALRGNVPQDYIPDTNFARTILHLDESDSPEENIITTLNWFKQNSTI